MIEAGRRSENLAQGKRHQAQEHNGNCEMILGTGCAIHHDLLSTPFVAGTTHEIVKSRANLPTVALRPQSKLTNGDVASEHTADTPCERVAFDSALRRA